MYSVAANEFASMMDEFEWTPGSTITTTPILEWIGSAGATKNCNPPVNTSTDGAFMYIYLVQ